MKKIMTILGIIMATSTVFANQDCVEKAKLTVNSVARLSADIRNLDVNQTKVLKMDRESAKYSILARGASKNALICQYDISVSQNCDLVTLEKIGCSNFESMFGQ